MCACISFKNKWFLRQKWYIFWKTVFWKTSQPLSSCRGGNWKLVWEGKIVFSLTRCWRAWFPSPQAAPGPSSTVLGWFQSRSTDFSGKSNFVSHTARVWELRWSLRPEEAVILATLLFCRTLTQTDITALYKTVIPNMGRVPHRWCIVIFWCGMQLFRGQINRFFKLSSR